MLRRAAEPQRCPDGVDGFDELVHLRIGVHRRWGDAQPFGTARNRREVDRLNVDAVGEQELVRDHFAERRITDQATLDVMKMTGPIVKTPGWGLGVTIPVCSAFCCHRELSEAGGAGDLRTFPQARQAVGRGPLGWPCG